MNYLTALVAFSAVMIVLSTLTTVAVETILKFSNRRATDFKELLTQLYEKSVKKRITVGANDTAEEFVEQIRKNPAFEGSGKIPLLRTAFDEMTTRQFVEQLARSQVGTILRKESEDFIDKTLSELAYDFERFGQAASGYFERRATFLAILAAFVMAVTLNVDALKLYGALARDTEMAQDVIEAIDVDALEQSALVTGENPDFAIAYDDLKTRVSTASKQLQGLGLPVGWDFFPFCSNEGKKDPTRCDSDKTRNDRILDYLVWFLRALLTTGLVGLGAPFWYKTYRSLGQMIPKRQPPGSESTEARQEKTSTDPSPQTGLESKDLLRIFKMVSVP